LLDLSKFSRVFFDDFKELRVSTNLSLAPGGPIIELTEANPQGSSTVGNATWIANLPWNTEWPFVKPVPGNPFTLIPGGGLNIIAQQIDGIWSSGNLAAADAAGNCPFVPPVYGYWEIKAAFPAGGGTWPAFWLGSLVVQPCQTDTLEVDIVEWYGDNPAQFSATIHEWDGNGQELGVLGPQWINLANPTEMNLYGVDIAPAEIIFYLNRKPVWSIPTPAYVGQINTGLYPIIDLDLTDPTEPGPFVMQVAHLAVYSLLKAS
jgi:hypothetical protein